jgi:hypothetical protein
LKTDVDSDDRFLAGHLALALRIPDNRHCFLVDDRPVLTFWGFNSGDGSDPPVGVIHPEDRSGPRDAGGSPQPADARTATPTTPPPRDAAAAPPPTSRLERKRVTITIPWWTWPALLLPILFLLFLLRGCWHNDTVPTDTGKEPAEPPPASSAASDPPPPPSAEPVAEPRVPEVIPSTLPASEAVLAEPQVPDSLLGKPQVPEAILQEPGAILVIPPDAAASGAVDFLNGLWRAETTLLDADTQEPVEFEYVIANGAGELRVTRRDGGHCTAPVTARMEQRDLILEGPEPIRCADGAVFGRPRLRCHTGVDGRTECTGQNPNDSRFEVQLRRAGAPMTPVDRAGPNFVAPRPPTKHGAS